MACQQDLRAAGKAYPRTCEDCGLGPCKKRLAEQMAPVTQRSAPLGLPENYYVSFDTLDMPGKIVAVKVSLGKAIISDMNKGLRVDLANHPQYRALEAYVLANPSPERRK